MKNFFKIIWNDENLPSLLRFLICLFGVALFLFAFENFFDIYFFIIDDEQDRVFQIFPVKNFFTTISVLIFSAFLWVLADMVRGSGGSRTKIYDVITNKKIRDDYEPYGCFLIIALLIIFFFLTVILDFFIT